jgi:hypothetical protein
MGETHLSGPLLVGRSSEFGQDAINGSSTAPLIAIGPHGQMGYVADSSARISMYGAGGVRLGSYTTDYVRFGTTGVFTTANTDALPHFVIPVSTGNLSSADAPATLDGGAALVWVQSTVTPGAKGALWVYTTRSTGWMASTTLAWTATATGPA